MKSKISHSVSLKPKQHNHRRRFVIPSRARDLLFLPIAVLASSLMLCFSAMAQQTAPSLANPLQSYDLGREVSLLGTVVKYDPASTVPPIGAHVLVQTGSGQVDVHLGNARILQANELTLNAGDNVRIVGETLALGDGTYFAARIVQKGLQAVAVRNSRGFPLKSAPPTPAQREALRGVR